MKAMQNALAMNKIVSKHENKLAKVQAELELCRSHLKAMEQNKIPVKIPEKATKSDVVQIRHFPASSVFIDDEADLSVIFELENELSHDIFAETLDWESRRGDYLDLYSMCAKWKKTTFISLPEQYEYEELSLISAAQTQIVFKDVTNQETLRNHLLVTKPSEFQHRLSKFQATKPYFSKAVYKLGRKVIEKATSDVEQSTESKIDGVTAAKVQRVAASSAEEQSQQQQRQQAAEQQQHQQQAGDIDADAIYSPNAAAVLSSVLGDDNNHEPAQVDATSTAAGSNAAEHSSPPPSAPACPHS